jgi:HK97 family phage major capsid protein/HK97 family phage prohead protease
MDRAYSTFEIKAVHEDQRIIEGIATTPSTDRMGDIVEPSGAVFKTPLPFLWQHNSREPIGHVTKAKITPDGITIRAELVKFDEPGPLKDSLDRAWQMIKTGLVRGLSIGFNPIESADIKGSFGQRFTRWEWLELSAVTIPANIEASIATVKSFDVEGSAASGTIAPVSSPRVRGSVKAILPNPGASKVTITEQIKQFEATRQAKAARMDEIMKKAGDAGETLDATQSEEYDGLEAEVAEVDKHLVRLRKQEQVNKAQAAALPAITDTTSGTNARGNVPVITVKPNVEKGIGFARAAMALLNCKGNRYEAAQYVKQTWPDQPELETFFTKAAVTPGTTTDSTWAGPLAPVIPLVNEFIDLLRPSTLIGRISGLRKVPFNVSIPKTTSGGAVSWVGQAKPKPVRALAFGTVSLPFAKAAGIVVLTKELVQLSTPSAQEVVRDTMIDTMRVFLDTQFIDPTVAISANVSPASITNGVTGFAATGTTEAAARADLRALMATMSAANYEVGQLTLIMSSSVAFTLGSIVNALGQTSFPGLGPNGGTIMGVPVVTSNVVGTQIVAVHAPSVLFADDGQTSIDVSEQASVQMDDAPTDPLTSTQVMVSLWQANLVGLRFDRFATWLKARSDAVNRITAVAYV